MNKFELISKYQPTGDQPQAVGKLVDGINRGLKHQVLLGVTGSGKTFNMANIIESVQRGDADAAERAIQKNWQCGAERLGRVIESLGERGSW